MKPKRPWRERRDAIVKAEAERPWPLRGLVRAMAEREARRLLELLAETPAERHFEVLAREVESGVWEAFEISRHSFEVRDRQALAGERRAALRRARASAWQKRTEKKARRLIATSKLSNEDIGARLAAEAGVSAGTVSRYVAALRGKRRPPKI